MKLLIVILIFALFQLILTAQEDPAPAVEIFCVTVGLPSSPIMTFTMTAQSQCWGKTSGFPLQEEQFYLTDDYDQAIYVPEYNNMGSGSAGFDFLGFHNGFPIVTFGLYKFTNNLNNKYFYLNYRDCRATNYLEYPPNYPSWLNSIDIWIRYNHNTGNFEYQGGKL